MMKGRFGWVPLLPSKQGKKRVWIQAVSVGELLAIEGLVTLLSQQEDVELVLSTTTSTGFELAKQKYGKSVLTVLSFPLDFWFAIQNAWNRIDPDLCVITEAELWPEHIHTAYQRRIPLLLINARLSDKSFRRMSSAKWLQPLFYQKITHVAASSAFDADRILTLGYPAERLTVTGNLKFDVVDSRGMSAEEKQKLAREVWCHFKAPSGKLWTLIGASTWPGEEALLIEAALKLQQEGTAIRLLLTPRHAERRHEIRVLLEGFGERIRWQFRSRSDWSGGSDSSDALQVMVADTTGELKRLLQLADLAVIGRSFPPHTEGQTPIEAAALGIPVVYGPSLSNFRAICKALEAEGGACRVDEPARLPNVLKQLFEQPDKRQALRDAAVGVFEKSRGSTQRTVQLIRSHF